MSATVVAILQGILLGLALGTAVYSVIVIAFLGIDWLKEYIQTRRKEKENHKVAFVSTREAVDSYVKSEASKIPMDELERICEQTPYVSALVDEKTGDIVDCQGIKPEEVDANFRDHMKQMDGIMVFE